jgi:hypothetical protein
LLALRGWEVVVRLVGRRTGLPRGSRFVSRAGSPRRVGACLLVSAPRSPSRGPTSRAITARVAVGCVPLRRAGHPPAEAGEGRPRRVRGGRSRSSGHASSDVGGPRSSDVRIACRLPGFPGAGLAASGVRGLASILGSPAEAGHLGSTVHDVPRGHEVLRCSAARLPEEVRSSRSGIHTFLSVLPRGVRDRGGAVGSKVLLHRRVRNVPGPFPAPERPILPWASFPSQVLHPPLGRREWCAGRRPLRVLAVLPLYVLIPRPLRSSDLGGRSTPKRGAVFGVCPVDELRSLLLLRRSRS